MYYVIVIGTEAMSMDEIKCRNETELSPTDTEVTALLIGLLTAGLLLALVLCLASTCYKCTYLRDRKNCRALRIDQDKESRLVEGM